MLQPKIIQGGMGVAVSGWTLARTVSKLGQLGVVSGTGLAIILARSLQLGDLDGHLRHALSRFPVPEVAARVLEKYFVPGGKSPSASFKLAAMPTLRPGPALVELTVLANFVEVFLAKDGHGGLVGINYLEKIQLPTLPSLYGAMLADVDYILMGAGIPRAIPGALDRMAQGEPAQLKIDVIGAQPGEEFLSTFDPRAFFNGQPPVLKRPQFLGIVASVTLAMTLARKASGHVDGFVIEGDTAGGHNAPPRGPLQLNAIGEPIYGERDIVDLEKIRELGRPFWLAGSYGRPGRLADALRQGASGVQVGTAFAFCNESGLRPELKQQALQMSRAGTRARFHRPDCLAHRFSIQGGSDARHAFRSRVIMRPGRASATWVISGIYIANRTGHWATVARPSQWMILSKKAGRSKTRKAENVFAMDWSPTSASARCARIRNRNWR